VTKPFGGQGKTSRMIVATLASSLRPELASSGLGLGWLAKVPGAGLTCGYGRIDDSVSR